MRTFPTIQGTGKKTNQTHEDMTGTFTLKSKRTPELGTLLGEWITVDDALAFFQPIKPVDKTHID